ncbi:tyrosine-type recombinase/integrase [Magnetospirillum sulfuroxidans]|uniref:Tyrosine-type recombinase/integrase n=1 Tax=Magnetospirillum sulfuroxidans TaxID=611300 RepID=A0ABS5I8Y6_9PROT|nr:site-specific integrase [Magnetospirillum sulfuroxidans]MBR9970875.1 tyrosine-type recombinase/integrase [Magnetospirillum sulfuroxidans]
MKLRLKYVVEDVDRHGNVRVYVRRNGRKKRLLAEIGSPEFVVEYRAAIAALEGEVKAADAPTSQGSLRWLIEKYYECAEFKRLDDRTRRVRRGILDKLCAAGATSGGTPYGQKPFARMEPRHVRAMRDARADAPEAANSIVKALRQVFSWATDDTVLMAQTNPARDVPYLKGNPEGFHTWTLTEVEQFETAHPIGTKARLALALLLFTGVRRSDVVHLGPQMIRNGHIHWTEAKGRQRMTKVRQLPLLPELRAILDSTQSGHLAYLVTEFGKPFTANGFGNWFRKRCNEAGLVHCSAHGLRKAGATIAAENGATEHQLMAIYGWESPKQAALYTKKANRKILADSAMHLLIPAERNEDQSVPLPEPPRTGGTKKA